LEDWNSILEAPTEVDFIERLQLFSCKHPEKAVKYCVDVWLLWKKKLVGFWVDLCLHFGIRVTSPIEGCYAGLKAYIKTSTGDLKSVFDALEPYWRKQHRTIFKSIADEKNKVNHQANRPLFEKVQSLVYD
jgi:hypothetical protein